MEKTTYTIRRACGNCKYEETHEKNKGLSIQSWSKEKCPECGCFTLVEYVYDPGKWEKTPINKLY